MAGMLIWSGKSRQFKRGPFLGDDIDTAPIGYAIIPGDAEDVIYVRVSDISRKSMDIGMVAQAVADVKISVTLSNPAEALSTNTTIQGSVPWVEVTTQPNSAGTDIVMLEPSIFVALKIEFTTAGFVYLASR